jgi:hypothetical protein
MGRDAIEQATRSIRVSQRRRESIERELRTHLEDRRAELESSGLTAEDATIEVLSRFGDPDEIASSFDLIYRPNRRTQITASIALAGMMLLGVYGLGGSLASATSAHHRPTATPHVAHQSPPRHRE